MWSVFYMLVEFAQGGLPWRKLKDKVSLFSATAALPIEIRNCNAMHQSKHFCSIWTGPLFALAAFRAMPH